MITKEIYQVGGSGFTAPEDAAVYLIHMDGTGSYRGCRVRQCHGQAVEKY